MLAAPGHEWYNSETHRVAATAALPRLLRAALTKINAHDALVDVLVTEVAAIDARLVEPLRAAIDDCRFPELRQHRVASAPAAPSVMEVVRKLDRKAVRNAPAAAGIGNVLLIIFGDPSDRAVCARLAAACRVEMHDISAKTLAQMLAAQAGLGSIDWRSVASMLDHHAVTSAPYEEGTFDDESVFEPALVLDPLVERALLIDAWSKAATDVLSDVRNIILGLSCLAAGQTGSSYAASLGEHANILGDSILRPVRAAAEARVIARYEQHLQVERRKRSAAEKAPKPTGGKVEPEPSREILPGHVLVAPVVGGGAKVKEITRGLEGILGKPLPLVPAPDLKQVRNALVAEFPHCEGIADRIVREMAGKPHVAQRPLLLRGEPGTGKSRFARRLGELLGVGVFRVDGSGDGGVAFGGTERRWYSTEPCKPFQACARFSQANPLILIDEIDKSPTRSEYGRLWDSLLGFLEKETAARYPDPCLQVELDVSHVLIVATANDIATIPGPLLDRFGAIVAFPKPDRSHLEALARHLAAEQATTQGLDPRFVEPFEAHELSVMRKHWAGGSVRRLGRIVATVMRTREQRDRGLPN